MNLRKFIIEDVRCFAGRHEFNIRPLTFLVGENSTGKSTVLGCIDAIARFLSFPNFGSELNFNVDPYQLGVFAEIARKTNVKQDKFKLGITFEDKSENEPLEYIITLVEKEKGSEPVIQEQRLALPKKELHFETIEIDNPDSQIQYKFLHDLEISERVDDGEMEIFKISVPGYRSQISAPILLHYSTLGMKKVQEKKSDEEFYVSTEESLRTFSDFQLRDFEQKIYSFAPVRSKPERTYNPLKESPNPEGSDVPMMLMNISHANRAEWEKLKNQLLEFGKSSGLFSDISVRRLGKSIGDPFQLQIKVRGPKANMIDVGYGVNQLLPILVRILNSSPQFTFLMQQPEVHLHPKGQAELSSLLAKLTKQRKHNFLIETHSDYMVDRARIEVMRGSISPKDVSLIYLEPVQNSVVTHNISIDKQGNLVGAPESYGEFFLKETNNLLGLT